jgi:uncharacterized membrane protein
MIMLLVMYVVFNVFLALIAIPLILGKIKPNGLYGFRVRDTLEDERVWYATNRHFGTRLLVVSQVNVLASVLLYVVPGLSLDTYALACLAILALAFAAAFVQSWRYMKSSAPSR